MTTKGNVLAMSVSTAFIFAAYFSWQRLLPLILRDLGASDLQISYSYSAIVLAMGLFQYPGGVLADRLGRKPVIVTSTYLIGLLYLAAAFQQDWQSFVAMIALANALNALHQPAFTALLAESVGSGQRGAAFALLEIFISIALTVGPALGAWLMPLSGFRPLLTATGVIAVLMGAVRQRFLVETLLPEETSAPKIRLGPFLERRVLLLVATNILYTLCHSLLLFGPFISLYAKDRLDFTPSQINLMFAIGSMVGIFLCHWGGKLTDRYGSAQALRVAAFLYVGTLLIWLRLPHFLWASLCFTISYAFFQVTMIAGGTLRADASPPGARGAVLGVVGGLSQTVSALALPLGGLAVERWGLAAPFFMALGFMTLAAYTSYALEQTLPSRPPVTSQASD